jgi:hypothetical protein
MERDREGLAGVAQLASLRGAAEVVAVVLAQVVDGTRKRLRYTNEDGTPTLWWALVNIVAPALLVIAIVVDAILTQ